MKQKSWVFDFILLGIVWGCSFIFIKLGLEFLTPVGVVFGRVSLGALSLLIIAKRRKIALPSGRRTWFILWVVSLLLNVIQDNTADIFISTHYTMDRPSGNNYIGHDSYYTDEEIHKLFNSLETYF